MYLLDTSALIEVFENTHIGRDIARYIQSQPFLVSALTLYELGKKRSPNPRLGPFLLNVSVVPFNDRAAAEASMLFQHLREARKPINEMDILIAGTALSRELELVTSDSDFGEIKKYSGLKLRYFKKS